MKINYLIIGQGLAGSLLAWELIKRQKTVIIVDNGKENASQIAAGLINPITGMRLVISNNVDQLLPTAKNYYKALSEYFHQNFYVDNTMLRFLRSEREILACKKRLLQAEYHHYLSKEISSYSLKHSLVPVIKQYQTGYLLTRPLLSALKSYFISQQAYRNEEIHYQDIELSTHLKWKDIRPENIIFCEGYHGVHNPWFSRLPFQLVKGEIITASSTKTISQNILNYGHWYIPLNSNQFRTGATFDRDNLDTKTTIEAKKNLLTSLSQVYPELSIKDRCDQHVGIRPTTLDKLPFIGNYPGHPKLHIFNGFGAKGSLQIPWYCQRFAEHLLNNQPIPDECNINRY